MIFDIARLLVVLLIAVPFIYMVYDVTLDVSKRFYGFSKTVLKPVPVKSEQTYEKRV